MNNTHDEIKKLLKASRTMLSSKNSVKESYDIKKKYNLITEDNDIKDDGVDLAEPDVLNRINTAKAVEDEIEDDTKTAEDKNKDIEYLEVF